MRVVSIPNGVFAENCYLIVDEQAQQCAVVDPGEDAGLILHKIRETGATLVGIWLTHAHLDHVTGVARVAEETGGGVPVWLHPGDRPLYDAVPQQAGAFGLAPPPDLPAPNREMVHGEQLAVGQLRFEIRHAPGHSPGSVCLIGHGVAFSGDVLFAGSIGRTDLPGGDFETLISSIERELLSLPDETIVYSGHGPETTIGRERGANPFLTGVHRIG
jgi:hydroxyacylglutathione hydrolase